jgi:hypothetical protein
MGIGAHEKQVIGDEFKRRARNLNLVLDIESDENKRIYGDGWYQFLARCKGTLGSESGVTIFDIDDRVRETCELIHSYLPDLPFEDLWKRYLHRFEDNIYYRTMSPRIFEAAAFQVCQIMFEGKYSGVVEPMVHYIPLKQDFSNFAEVLGMFRNRSLRNFLTMNSYKGLILSGTYSYQSFMDSFDRELMKEGLIPERGR